MGKDEEKGKTILCIEDEAGMLDLFRLILERRGFRVLGALDAQTGLDLMQKEKPALVLLDIMMPQVDGWEVFRQMKTDENLKDIPVIIVTARTQPIDVILARHVAKVDDYITKPFGPQELWQRVDQVLSRKKGA